MMYFYFYAYMHMVREGLFLKILNFIFIYVYLCEFMCTTGMQEPMEAGRRDWIPCNWSHRWFEPPDVGSVNWPQSSGKGVPTSNCWGASAALPVFVPESGSYCSPGWSGTPHDPTLSAFWVLELEMWVTLSFGYGFTDYTASGMGKHPKDISGRKKNPKRIVTVSIREQYDHIFILNINYLLVHTA